MITSGKLLCNDSFDGAVVVADDVGAAAATATSRSLSVRLVILLNGTAGRVGGGTLGVGCSSLTGAGGGGAGGSTR